MNNYKWVAAIVLSLALAASSVIASAHNHNQHSNAACSVCVVHDSAVIVGAVNSLAKPDFVPLSHITLSTPHCGCNERKTHLARAPPASLVI
jgi:hypothetical protein